MKRLTIPILTGVLGGGLWAGIGPSLSVGVIPYGEISLYGSMFLAGPLALVSVLLLVSPSIRRSGLPGVGLGISALLLVSLIGLPRADNLKRRENRQAQAYSEHLIQRLDAYKAEHVEYPDGIEAFLPSDRRSLPFYLRGGDFYAKRTNSFSLGWIDSPRFPICSGGTSYQRDTGRWDCCAVW